MAVRSQTNLVRRGGVWYFRKKVPSDLRDHYRRESIRKSLRHCTTLAEAKQEATNLAAQHEAAFEAIRRTRSAPPAPLPAELPVALAQALEAHVLQADDEWRMAGMTDEEFAEQAAATEAELAGVRADYARGRTASISHTLMDWLHHLGLEVDPQDPLMPQV
jgi:hypothetical protein